MRLRARGGSGGDELITTVAGRALTANPSAAEIAGSDVTPGGFSVTISGIVVSLDPSGEFIIGTETISLKTSTEELGSLIMGGLGPVGPYITGLPGPRNGTTFGTSSLDGLQAYKEIAQDQRSCHPRTLTLIVSVAVILMHI